ncbi:hypothetical protein B1L11_37985 [Microbispora sp. GKU 823]|nr:hypothetical protein B1L11_37985 [Microbispora sp. GKU 823]
MGGTERARGTAERARGGTAPGRARTGASKGAREAAPDLPVARVVVDTPLPHLDRPFDYLVPTTMDAEAVPGCRVRVRFAGQLADGYLLERLSESEHEGRLSFLERVISPEPVLTPDIARLARAVADRYAGTMSDVLRLAVPPRHARVEAEARTPRAPGGFPPAPAPARAPTATPGGPTRRAPPSWRRWPRTGRRAPCGRPCPARTRAGRRGRTPIAAARAGRRWTAAGASSWWCPTARTWRW